MSLHYSLEVAYYIQLVDLMALYNIYAVSSFVFLPPTAHSFAMIYLSPFLQEV